MGADLLRAVCPRPRPLSINPSTGAPQGGGRRRRKKGRHKGQKPRVGPFTPAERWRPGRPPRFPGCLLTETSRRLGRIPFIRLSEETLGPELNGWSLPSFRVGRRSEKAGPSLPEGSPAISSLSRSEPFLRTSSLSPGLHSTNSQDLVSPVIGRTDADTETPVLWPSDAKSWSAHWKR